MHCGESFLDWKSAGGAKVWMPPPLLPPKCVFQSLVRTVVMLANASTHHGHIPQAKLSLTVSSMWIWGLSRGYFNLTLLFQPQASRWFLKRLQAIVSVQAVTSKALAWLLLSHWGWEGFLHLQAGSTVGHCRARLCPRRRIAWLCFQTTTGMRSQAE